jgi:hypothetical protein
VCQHCDGHFDTTTVIGHQDTSEPIVEPGPETTGEAAALRVTRGRIVRLMLEVIGGRRPAGQLATVADAPVLRYLRATRPVAHTGAWVVRSVRVCAPAEQVVELAAVVRLRGPGFERPPPGSSSTRVAGGASPSACSER